jgi:hypothetical protein
MVVNMGIMAIMVRMVFIFVMVIIVIRVIVKKIVKDFEIFEQRFDKFGLNHFIIN